MTLVVTPDADPDELLRALSAPFGAMTNGDVKSELLGGARWQSLRGTIPPGSTSAPSALYARRVGTRVVGLMVWPTPDHAELAAPMLNTVASSIRLR